MKRTIIGSVLLITGVLQTIFYDYENSFGSWLFSVFGIAIILMGTGILLHECFKKESSVREK